MPSVGAGQVLIRVHAVGVNPVETYIRSGRYALPPMPYTPGSDAAGVVEAVGSGVSRVAVGDRVYTAGTISGAYAEFALCKDAQVYRLAERLSFEQGAGIHIPYATAWRALYQRARGVAGETVFVHGASGGVGMAATQLARAGGFRVVGSAGTDAGRELVRREGAHEVLDHTAPDYLERLMTLTGGRGTDIILEMLANVNLARDLTVVAKGGRIAVIGNRGTIEINPRDAMSREAAILGVLLFGATDAETASIHAGLGAGFENGTLRPVVGRRFSLAEAAAAHHAILAPGALGKIVLVP